VVPCIDGLDERNVSLENLVPPSLLGGVLVHAAVLGYPLLVSLDHGLGGEVASRESVDSAGAGEDGEDQEMS